MLKRMVVLGILAVVAITLTTVAAIGDIKGNGANEPALANGQTGVLSPDELAPPVLAGASGVISPGAALDVPALAGGSGVISPSEALDMPALAASGGTISTPGTSHNGIGGVLMVNNRSGDDEADNGVTGVV